MKKIKWFCSFVLVICMLTGGASAQLTGIDETLSEYLGVNDEMRFSMNLQFEQLMPFADETLTKINSILSHLNIKSSVVTGSEDVNSTIRLAVDDDALFELTEVQNESGSTLETTLLKNRILTSAGSAMDAISGNTAGDEIAFDGLEALREAEANYQALTDAIVPYAEEKSANFKIDKVGYARWVRLAKLDTEASAELAPLICAVLGSGMDDAFREQLSQMTFRGTLTVALYQLKEGGDDIAVYIKGDVAFADESKRTLNYLWAFASTDSQRKDTYKFEMKTEQRPTDNRVIAASYTRVLSDKAMSVKGSHTTTLRAPDVNNVTKVEHLLSGDVDENTKTVVGTQITTVKDTADDTTTTKTTTYAPDLMLTSSEGSGVLTGNVRFTQTEGKKETSNLMVIFDEASAEDFMGEVESGSLFAVESTMPQSSLDQNEEFTDEPQDEYLVGAPPLGMSSFQAPSEMVSVDLDSISQEQMDKLKQEMFQELAGRMVIAVSKLPISDIGLLSDGLTTEDYTALLKLLSE